MYIYEDICMNDCIYAYMNDLFPLGNICMYVYAIQNQSYKYKFSSKMCIICMPKRFLF